MNKNIKLIVNFILLIDFIFIMWVFDIEYSPSKAQIILLLLTVSLLITDFKDSTEQNNAILVNRTKIQNNLIYLSVVIQVILCLYNFNIGNFATNGIAIGASIAFSLAYFDII